MDAFYAEFNAWARTATESDVLAILEPEDDVETMIADVFDPCDAVSGTAHDPCGASSAAAPACADGGLTPTAAEGDAATNDAEGDAATNDGTAAEASSAAGIALGALGTVLAGVATLTA